MKKRLFSLLSCVIASLYLSVVGCTKSEDNGNNHGGGTSSNDVVVTTYSPVDVTAFSAVCGGSVQVVQGLVLTKIGVCWGTSPNPTVDGRQLSSEAWNEPFVRTLTGLSPSTVYHVRAFALRGLEYYYGEEKTFTTVSNGGGGGNNGGGTLMLPTVATLQMTDITQTSAVSGGYVTEDGGATVLDRGLCWSTSSEPTLNDSHSSNGSGLGNYSMTINNLMPNMTYHVRAYATNSVGTGYGNDVSFTTLPGGGSINGHDYVDLGLPSGTLWATCNVGATTPSGYGKYYSWAEIQSKVTYDWSTYRYCKGTENTLTKYCGLSDFGYNGFTDELICLQAEDDAASVNWGSGWRTPTKEDWEELCQNTTNIWTTQDGVYGRCFTSINGASLFLPAAGMHDQHGGEWAGTHGCYWTSSLYSNSVHAHQFFFVFDTYKMYACTRRCGLSIRPVRSSY